jgi:hypothetical protein
VVVNAQRISGNKNIYIVVYDLPSLATFELSQMQSSAHLKFSDILLYNNIVPSTFGLDINFVLCLIVLSYMECHV